EAILGGRALQVRLTPDASGSAEIEYGISDGRDGQDSSTIQLDVSAATQNGAPEQTDKIEAEVVAGQAVEVNILNDVRDPDGDDVYLSGAQAQDTLNVSVRPDGTVTITDLGIRTGLQQVVVDVSDGQLTAQVTIDLEVL